jgi:IS30 family transposase
VYKWDWAQKRADKRSRRQPGNRAISKAVWSEVRQHLVDDQWSPEQISGYLARDGIRISHETIYKWIRQDKRDRGTLYKHLRHRLKHRSRPVGAKRVNIPDRVSIHERPAEADGRRFGDLEMDTIVGPNNQHAIVTVIERNTNRLFMEKLKYGKDAEQLARAVIAMLSPFKDSILSITTDNGTEFTCHKMITEALGAQVYFADPYSSWQKGAIENANGLIRQYIPKGMPFSELDEGDIGEIADKINARPRKKLGFETPMACFEEKFKKCHSNIK